MRADLILTHTGSGGGGYGPSRCSVNALATPRGDCLGMRQAIASGGVTVASTPLHTNNTYARDETDGR